MKLDANVVKNSDIRYIKIITIIEIYIILSSSRNNDTLIASKFIDKNNKVYSHLLENTKIIANSVKSNKDIYLRLIKD